jgi:hypothetical protein
LIFARDEFGKRLWLTREQARRMLPHLCFGSLDGFLNVLEVNTLLPAHAASHLFTIVRHEGAYEWPDVKQSAASPAFNDRQRVPAKQSAKPTHESNLSMSFHA